MADKTVAFSCSAHATSLKDEEDDQKNKLSFPCKEGERTNTAVGDASSLQKMSKRPKKNRKLTQRSGLSYMTRKQNSSEYASSFTGSSAESFQSRVKDTTINFGSLKNTKQFGRANKQSWKLKSYNQGHSNEKNRTICVYHDVQQLGCNGNRQKNKRIISVGKCAAGYTKFSGENRSTDDDSDDEKPHSITTRIRTRNSLHSSCAKLSTVRNLEENRKRRLYVIKEEMFEPGASDDDSDGEKPHSVTTSTKTRDGLQNSSIKMSTDRNSKKNAKKCSYADKEELFVQDGEKPFSVVTDAMTQDSLYSSSTKMSTVENVKESTKRCLYAERSNGARGNDKEMRGSLSKDTSTTINKKQIQDETQENKEDKYILLCRQPILNKQEITRSISEKLNLISTPQLQQLSTTNMHILLPKSSTREMFVITVNEVTVKLTLRNHKCHLSYSTEEASNAKQCQCEGVLAELEKTLQEKDIQFSTLKAFDGKAFLKHLANLTPIDYYYVNKTESLELKLDETMCKFLSSCVTPSDTDVESYVNSVDVNTASWSLGRFAGLRQTYINTRRELSELEKEFLAIEREQEDRNNKHRENSKDLQDQQAESIEISNSSDAKIINQKSNECSSASKCDDQNEISRSRLLSIIAMSLTQKEWFIVRKEVSNVLSRRDRIELDQLQNGVDIFNYLQRRERLDDEAQLDNIRNLVFIIGRVDLAHVIDCFRQDDYSSLLSVSELIESKAIGAGGKKERHRGMDDPNSANCTGESDGSPVHTRQQNADNHLHDDSRLPLEHIEIFPDSVNDDHNPDHCEDIEVSCEHYERFCTVKFGCCPEFWACHRCHNTKSKCGKDKLSSCDVQLIKCNRCNKIQEFPKERPHCIQCNLKFSEYFCPICKHLTGTQNNPYHCKDCGICRVNAHKSFHCEICGYCMDVCLKGKHKCRPNSAHDKCFICLEDGFTGCQILPCSHKVHKECAQTMLRRGMTRCPICRESFAHVLNRRPVRK